MNVSSYLNLHQDEFLRDCFADRPDLLYDQSQLSQSGAYGLNVLYEQGHFPSFQILDQALAGELALTICNKRSDQVENDMYLMLNYALSHQDPSGSFPGTTWDILQWTLSIANAICVVQNFFPNHPIESYVEPITLTIDWLLSVYDSTVRDYTYSSSFKAGYAALAGLAEKKFGITHYPGKFASICRDWTGTYVLASFFLEIPPENPDGSPAAGKIIGSRQYALPGSDALIEARGSFWEKSLYVDYNDRADEFGVDTLLQAQTVRYASLATALLDDVADASLKTLMQQSVIGASGFLAKRINPSGILNLSGSCNIGLLAE